MAGNHIINRIKQQVESNENSFQCMVLGATGTGKSFTALRFCEVLDRTFCTDRIVFTPQDFLKLVKDLKPGQAILCDEIGSWLSGRDWMTTLNKLMSIVLETYRFKRLIVFWTVPHQRMVDINLRGLCHATIETIAVSRKENTCEVKLKYRKVNPITGNIYERFPVIRNDGGVYKTLTRIKVNRPSKWLEYSYLKKKEEHMEKVYEEMNETLENGGKKPVEERKNNYSCKCGHEGHTESLSKVMTCGGCGSKIKNPNYMPPPLS